MLESDLVARWRRVWSHLTTSQTPDASVRRRRQSQFLATLSLVSILLLSLHCVVLISLGRHTALSAATNCGSIVLNVIVFILNRRGHYVAAAYVLTLGYFAVVHSALVSDVRLLLFYTGTTLILSGILLPLRTTVLLVLASTILGAIGTFAMPSHFIVRPEDPLIFAIFDGATIVFLLWHRAAVERERHAELGRSEARWRSLVESAPVAIMEVNRAHQMRFVNHLGSFQPDEVIDQSVYEFIDPAFHDALRTAIDKTFETGQIQRLELIGTDADTTKAWFSASISPLPQSADEDRVIIVAQNITDQKRAEEQRLELAIQRDRAQLLEELISNISHDIRSPLTAATNYAYLLRKRTSEAKQTELVDYISIQIGRVNSITDGMLAVAELTQLIELPLERINLAEVTANAIYGFSVTAAKRGITLTVQQPDDLPDVQANPPELARAIAILLDNALTYTPSKGTVTVTSGAKGDQAIIKVVDNGTGISEGDLPRIFDRFYRSLQARKTHRNGIGLGLTIARHIVALHNGSIQVESTPGHGSIFTITLPTAPAR